MEFKLVYGRTGSGKTTYIFDEIKNKIEQKNKIYIIVPEQFSFSVENHLLNVIEENSSINAEVLTLSRMADRVISETIGNNRVHLSKVGKSMIIYDVLDKQKNKLNFLRSSEKNMELALNMVTELKKHNIDSALLSDTIEKIDDKYLKLKLSDANNILKVYQQRIEQNYIDESDALNLLVDNIEQTDFFNDSIIYIDEFAGFTPNEYQIIEKLCTLAKELTVTVCTDSLELMDNKEDSLFYFNSITAEKLLDIAKKTGSYIEKVNLNDVKKFKNDELKFLEKAIYADENFVFENNTTNIVLDSYKNPYSECENIAQKIYKIVKEEKYRYRDIAVVMANMETYVDDIKEVFNKYNIPIFIDEKKDVNNCILIKFVVSLFNIFTSNFSYEAMFSYIKSGVLDIEEDDIFLLEKYVNKWGIRGSKWYKQDFEYEEKNDQQDKINKIRLSIIDPILKLKNDLSGEKTAKEINYKLYEFIEENNIQKNILKKADEFEKMGMVSVADEYRAGIEIFFNVLDEIFLIFENDKMSFDRYNKILQTGIAKSEFGRIPSSLDQVLIGDIERSKTKEIKVLFLIGVNDGVIPKIIKDEGFLNDRDRKVLKENDVELAKDSVELLYENRFNIYKVLTIPTEKLYLSYSVADKEGKALRCSILITQIKKIFPEIEEHDNVIDDKHDISTAEATLDCAIEEYRRYLDDDEIEQEWKDIILWYKKNESLRINRILRGAKFSNLPEKISTENIKKMYGKTLRTSVSRLEQYRRCPFSFHMKYGLKLNEEEKFEIRSLDTGNFMHDVIDDFFEMVEQKRLDIKLIDENQLKSIVYEIVNRKMGMNKNYIFRGSPKFIVLSRRLKKVVYQSIEYIVKQLKNSKFELYGHEVEFSEKAELKPMKIELDDKKQVVVTGKIDRVDIAKMNDDTFVRIIDYKSSVKDIDLNQVVSGIQIQLLTYLDEIAEQENFQSAGILYFNLIDTIVKADKNLSDEEIKQQLNKKFKMKGLIVADIDIVKMMDTKLAPSTYSESIPVYLDKDGNISRSKSSVLDREKFESLQKYTKHIISDISNEIFEGNIDIKPFYNNKKTPCDYCEYRSICNFNPNFNGNVYRFCDDVEGVL